MTAITDTPALSRRLLYLVSIVSVAPLLWAGPDWKEVQDIKVVLLEQAAEHAMEQQKCMASEPLALSFDRPLTCSGNLEAKRLDPDSLDIMVTAAPAARGQPASDKLKINLPKPINMLAGYSGLAMQVKTSDWTSPELRWGVRLIGKNGNVAEIAPVIPLLSKWGEMDHEIYLDWAFINYGKVEDAIAVLRSVVALEFTVAGKLRSPEYGPSREPKTGHFTLSNLRLVDYLKGSFDPNRHNWGWDGSDKKDLTLQHRTQEVSGVVARFGGKPGLESALDSLDMAARTQCWDGSFIETRRGPMTVVTGEYTHGFTLWGLTDAYAYLEKIQHPALEETITIGTRTRSRRDHYQQMLYQAAMSRADFLPSVYRDDIIHSNTLIYGANRVLGYAVAMRRAADYLRDPEQKEAVMEHYAPIIEEIADAQGAFSGGFPLLGEGDRYDGKGIHYDSGYIRTHMDWLVVGIKATGDPTLVRMLDRYQSVFTAAMNGEGTGILPLISERGHSESASKLVIPDATAQVGIKYKLPVIAQWGYNVGAPAWEAWEPGARVNHFTWASHVRGYSLGAHISILLFDLDPNPEPIDIGFRFPRQFPIWSSRFYQKDSGDHVRTSRMQIHPGGTFQNNFKIEVGEYLETIGIPVWIKSPDASVTVEAVSLEGWPTLLDDEAQLYLEYQDKKLEGSANNPFELVLEGTEPIRITVTGPDLKLPAIAGGNIVTFRTEFLLVPTINQQRLTVTIGNDTQSLIEEPL